MKLINLRLVISAATLAVGLAQAALAQAQQPPADAAIVTATTPGTLEVP
jgi:hypothetical protein